jgi:chromosome segregation ATPase
VVEQKRALEVLLRSVKESTSAEISELKDSLNTATVANDGLRSDLNNHIAESSANLTEALTIAQEEIDELTKSNRELHTKLEVLEADSPSKAAIDSLRLECDAAQKRACEQETANTAMVQQLGVAENELGTAQGTIARLTSDVNRLEATSHPSADIILKLAKQRETHEQRELELETQAQSDAKRIDGLTKALELEREKFADMQVSMASTKASDAQLAAHKDEVAGIDRYAALCSQIPRALLAWSKIRRFGSVKNVARAYVSIFLSLGTAVQSELLRANSLN